MSTRVKEASQADLAHEAKLSEEIVKNQERDRKRDETHALTVATSEKVDALALTIADSKQDTQLAILQRIDRFFDLVDKVRKHRLTKLVVAIVTLLAASYAAKLGLHL